MAKRTITRLYDNYDDAAAVVSDLEASGIPHSDISLVANRGEERETGPGAGIGAVVGGGAGLLAGIGAIAIPGIGPVVAAGWLVATLVGVGVGGAAGGVVGSLVKSGVSDDEAHVYAEGVRRGGSLVSARVEESVAPAAERIMNGREYVDWTARGAEYRASGWNRFDDAAGPYSRPRTLADAPMPRR